MSEKASNKKISSVANALEKRFGEKMLFKMSDPKYSDAKTLSSGRPDLDNALGGGYAVGKIVEIFAEPGVGKTGLALEAIASVQKIGGIAAIIDAEHALQLDYCEQIGVDIDELRILQPSYGEQAIEALRYMVDSGEFDLIVVDSVAALIPLAELNGEAGEAKIGGQAKMMSQGIRMITGLASATECTVIFINQLRSTISAYGPAKKTTGGNTLPYFATQRLEVKNKGRLKEGDSIVGFKQNIRVIKNKLRPPFAEIDNDIIFGKGVDKITGFIAACLEKNLIEKAGSIYRYNGDNIAKGIKKLREFLEDNEGLVEELERQLKLIK